MKESSALFLCAISSIHSYVHSNLGQFQITNQQLKGTTPKKTTLKSKKIEKSSNQTIYFSFKNIINEDFR